MAAASVVVPVKKNPWGAIRAPVAASLADIQKQEQVQSDSLFAAKLQMREERASGLQAVEDDDAAFAARLQAEEDAAAAAAAAARPAAPAAAAAAAGPTEFVSMQDDEALAAALQAEFDAEHDRHIDVQERRANFFTNSKVSVSMDLHRRSLPSSRVPVDVEEDDSDHEPMEMVYDRSSRVMRDAATGDIVTKHNLDLGGVRMREKIDQLPLSFASGDMRKGTECTISNKIYKSLKRFSQKQKRQTARSRDSKKEEQSTHALALDAPTRLLLYKLVNGGVIDEVNGCLSTGKESVVFHGRYRPDPDAPAQAECAIKVFKTTLTEFKNRTAFLQGDRRFEARVGKQGARKLVRLWAEKEMSNLLRMEESGLSCPHVVRQRKHVLVMTFLGKDGVGAPKLKHAQLSFAQWVDCHAAVVKDMTQLYRECGLVHADLSEYNILYSQGRPHFIDVGQSVHTTHPRAREFLFRDCFHMHRFFTGMGVPCAPAAALFATVCGDDITPEQEVEFMRKVSAAKGRAIAEEETSRVCEQMPIVSRANPGVLLEGIEGVGSEESDEDDEVEGSTDSFVRVAHADAAEDVESELLDDEEEEEEEEEEEGCGVGMCGGGEDAGDCSDEPADLAD